MFRVKAVNCGEVEVRIIVFDVLRGPAQATICSSQYPIVADAPLVAPVETPKPPPPSADDLWRDEAVAVLSSCNEGCAKLIASRLRSIDVKDFAPAARAGVNECVAKCRRR